MKKKEEPFTLTHTEILNCAIQYASTQYQKEAEKNRKISQIDPSCVIHFWKQKLTVMLDLYKLETGNDYGYEFDLTD